MPRSPHLYTRFPHAGIVGAAIWLSLAVALATEGAPPSMTDTGARCPSIAYSLDGNWLAAVLETGPTADAGGEAWLIRTSGDAAPRSIGRCAGSIAFSDDSRRVYAGRLANGRCRLVGWDVTDLGEVRSASFGAQSLGQVTIASDGAIQAVVKKRGRASHVVRWPPRMPRIEQHEAPKHLKLSLSMPVLREESDGRIVLLDESGGLLLGLRWEEVSWWLAKPNGFDMWEWVIANQRALKASRDLPWTGFIPIPPTFLLETQGRGIALISSSLTGAYIDRSGQVSLPNLNCTPLDLRKRSYAFDTGWSIPPYAGLERVSFAANQMVQLLLYGTEAPLVGLEDGDRPRRELPFLLANLSRRTIRLPDERVANFGLKAEFVELVVRVEELLPPGEAALAPDGSTVACLARRDGVVGVLLTPTGGGAARFVPLSSASK